MSIQVILALLREKLHRAVKALSGPDGRRQFRVGKARIQQVRFPPQLCGGMGVGVGHQGQAIQGGNPPVHGRIGGKSRLHSMDVTRQVAEALLHRIKAGEGAEHGKVGRPDVCGNKLRIRAGLQRQLQQVTAVQPQDGAAVGADIAHGLQAGGQFVRRLQRGQQDQIVDLPGLAVALVDAADLPRDHKPRGLARGGVREAQIPPQGVDPFSGGNELLPQLRAPGGMGEIPGSHHLDPLPPGPPAQVRQIALLAGGAGKPGVDVKIGNVHESHLLSDSVPLIISASPQ